MSNKEHKNTIKNSHKYKRIERRKKANLKRVTSHKRKAISMGFKK